MILLAFWFGLLTAVSPCPLATNIAAISFLSRSVGSSRRILLSAALYTLGRTLAYVVLGVALLWAFQALAGGSGSLTDFASPASRHFQYYGPIALGPALLFVGMVLLGLVELNLSVAVGGSKLQERIAAGGAIWALPLGMLFAMAFCPPSAALFLTAMGLSLDHGSPVLPPLVYGIGTAVPVIAFGLVIAFASELVGRAFNMMTVLERWFRRITGAVFLLVGLHYILAYIYGIGLLGRVVTALLAYGWAVLSAGWLVLLIVSPVLILLLILWSVRNIREHRRRLSRLEGEQPDPTAPSA